MSRQPAAFRFIDLFAGIGGIRIALESVGGTCVMTSEWDRHARTTYERYFGVEDHFHGDIHKIDAATVPKYDVLAAGFPCQPFSLAGVSKKNSLGRSHGFDDVTQGTLFFEILRLIDAQRPAALLLENVKHLRRHDKGRTFDVIAGALTERGYSFSAKIIDSATVLPQHRERIFIVGFDSTRFPELTAGEHPFTEMWQRVECELELAATEARERYGVPPEGVWPRLGPLLESEVPEKYTLSDRLYQYLVDYREKHLAKGNGFGCSVVNAETRYTRTISARYYKDGSEALVERPGHATPRRLTPRECARLQGFPSTFEALFDRTNKAPVSDVNAYRQFGNSVTVPVVRAVAAGLVDALQQLKTGSNSMKPRVDEIVHSLVG